MTLEYLRSLPDDELKLISLEKNKKGNYTFDANKAMRVRNERSGQVTFRDISKHPPSYEKLLIEEKGSNKFIKKFK